MANDDLERTDSSDSSLDNLDQARVELSPLNTEEHRTPCDGGSDIAIEVIGDIDEKRGAWDSKVQFLLSIIGYAVGLGNVWRFPYLCQQNGGGAFLIPYTIMLVAEGIPLFYLELLIGQRLRKGSIGVWNEIHPYLGGLGYASSMVSFIVSLYYNIIIMWCLYYFFSSLTSVLPWTDCPMVHDQLTNVSVPVKECDLSDSTSYFWYRETLDISANISESGGIKWKMLLCLIAAWVIVFLCIARGIKSSGKVVYFTATFPYIVLLIFFGRGVTLPGAGDGLRHMFTPKLERLQDPQVWLDAATQIFYSLGLAFGGLIAYASYNPPKNNCRRDAILVSITNCSTSLFASVVIFSVLGFKATNMYEKCIDKNLDALAVNGSSWMGVPRENLTHDMYKVWADDLTHGGDNWTVIENMGLKMCSLTKELDTAAEGTGLAFIVFTQAIIEFPLAPFWSIMFFLMLLTLGLGSQFGTLEAVCTNVCDLQIHPWLEKKWVVSGLVCFISMIVGITFVQGSGEYWVKVFDSFAGTFPLMLVAFLEVVGVIYIYGMKRFTNDIKYITGEEPGLYWTITWRFVSPILMFVVLLASVISKFLNPPTYLAYDKETATSHREEYPVWVGVIITFLVLVSAMFLPIVAFLRKVGWMKSPKRQKVSTVEITAQDVSSTTTMLNHIGQENSDDDDDDDDMRSFEHRRLSVRFSH